METINIMINGLPGNVAGIMARHAVADKHFNVMPFSLSGPEIDQTRVHIENVEFELIKPDLRDKRIAEIQAAYPQFICIDYTHPTAVNANARFYVKNQIPFVMGTTGGDRKQLEADVQNSSTMAVIAPNMAKQIVGFQAMMEYAADSFPGLFSGYTLTVMESHQKGKADTSGTAKAVVASFQKLGVDFDVHNIQMIRDPEIQEKQWHIPKAHINGHGWHTYTLTAPDGNALFEFKHNINGRDIYASGTFDAVRFLADKIKQGWKGKNLFTMIDVLNRG